MVPGTITQVLTARQTGNVITPSFMSVMIIAMKKDIKMGQESDRVVGFHSHLIIRPTVQIILVFFRMQKS